MKIASWKTAADFINDTYFSGCFHVYLDQLVCNKPGKIEFRVPRVLVKDPDLYGYVKRHMAAVHGPGSVEHINLTTRLRQTMWMLDDNRAVGVRYAPGKGTFITLVDVGVLV